MCSISQTGERRSIVDFTHHIFLNELSFISQSPGLASQSFLFANAFSVLLWIHIAVSFCCLFGVLIVFKKIDNNLRIRQTHYIYLLAIYLNKCKYFISLFYKM